MALGVKCWGRKSADTLKILSFSGHGMACPDHEEVLDFSGCLSLQLDSGRCYSGAMKGKAQQV